MGRMINHDDTLAKKTLNDGFTKTSQAWYKKYREPYSQENPIRFLLTKAMIFFAIVFPIYGLWLLWKFHKYRKTTHRHVTTKKNEKSKDDGNYSGFCGINNTDYALI
ncbi:12184_t:CDS:2, partial [Ambispora leptoticha]